MRKDIFKKIITTTYLAIFLFGLLFPFNQSYAQDATNRLVVSMTPTSIIPGGSIKITAKVYTANGGETVSFSTTSVVLNKFDPEKCTVAVIPKNLSGLLNSPRIQSCSVTFIGGTVGTPTIKASVNTNGQEYIVTTYPTICKASEVVINDICKEPVPVQPLKCDPPQRLNDAKDSCILDTNTTYTPLAPLPGLGTDGCKDAKGVVITDPKTGEKIPCIDTQKSATNPCPFGNYLNIMIKIIIGIAAVLAMIMIVMGGIEYMTSDLISSKEAGKDTIKNAILGLLLALGAFLILNTINPQLLSACLDKLPMATITISPDDTSTGSSTSLCLPGNPPNPDSATGTSMKSVMSKPAMPEYEKAANTITSISKGRRYLITAQAGFEGFFPGSKSYKTNNPGNIGNTDDGKTKSFPTLAEGILAQTKKVVSGQGSYKIGGKYTCALGNETYDGSLYQYLRIYATGARINNNYVNAIIGHFKDNGKNITAKTKMTEIYNMQ